MAHPDVATATTPSRSVAAVVAAACLFGTTGTMLQRLAPNASANGVSAVRLLIGGVSLCLLARLDRRFARGRTVADPAMVVVVVVVVVKARTMRAPLLAGGIAVAGYQLCFFIGTTRTGVALATVITIGSGPVFSGIIDGLVFHRRPAAQWVLGTAVSIAGVIALGASRGTGSVDAVGVLAAAGSGLGWAIYATIGKRQIDRGLPSTVCMAALFTIAAVIVSPLLFTEHVGWVASTKGAGLAVYLGAFTVGAAYTLYGRGLRHLRAPSVITLTLAEPITAAMLSATVLHERIAPGGWVGITLVLAGLLITARTDRPADDLGSGPVATVPA